MDQTISLFSGTHFTLPTVVLNLGESASVGTGIWISTLLAVERLLNWDLAYGKTDQRWFRGSVDKHNIMKFTRTEVFSLWSCTRFCCVNASRSQTRSRSAAWPVHTEHNQTPIINWPMRRPLHTTTITIKTQRNDIVGITFRTIFPVDERYRHWQPIRIHPAIMNMRSE